MPLHHHQKGYNPQNGQYQMTGRMWGNGKWVKWGRQYGRQFAVSSISRTWNYYRVMPMCIPRIVENRRSNRNLCMNVPSSCSHCCFHRGENNPNVHQRTKESTKGGIPNGKLFSPVKENGSMLQHRTLKTRLSGRS